MPASINCANTPQSLPMRAMRHETREERENSSRNPTLDLPNCRASTIRKRPDLTRTTTLNQFLT